MKTLSPKSKIYKLIQDWLAENYGGEADNPCYDMKALAKHIEKNLAQTNNPTTFEEAARPLMKFLGDNYHPHCKAIVDSCSGEILEGQQSFSDVID